MRNRFMVTLSGQEGQAYDKFCRTVGHSEKEVARIAILSYMRKIIKEAEQMEREQHAGDGTEGHTTGLVQASQSPTIAEETIGQ